MDNTFTPIIKWAGGKRQLIDRIEGFLPTSYNTYIEPFFGGGALFCHLNPEQSIINDTNKDLIDMYTVLRQNPTEFYFLLEGLQDRYNCAAAANRQEIYYEYRTEFNTLKQNPNLTADETIRKAGLLVFLNKAGFNGLYRVNKKDEFNVPWGKKVSLNLYDKRNVLLFSRALQSTEILNGDFEAACCKAKEHDFVFLDPPYHDTFTDYAADGFTEDDQIRLANVCRSLTEHGVKFIQTNSATNFIKELYQEYNIVELDTRRAINCDGNNRQGKDIIILNY